MKDDALFSSVVLRPAAPGDEPAVAAIAREAFAIYEPRIGREPEPMVVDYGEIIGRGGLMVAVARGEIAGYLEIYLREDHLFIDKIAVSPRFQRQGMAHAMYGLIAVTARARGIDRLTLYTNARMHENIEMYERVAGFVVTERRREHGFERVYMTRELGA